VIHLQSIAIITCNDVTFNGWVLAAVRWPLLIGPKTAGHRLLPRMEPAAVAVSILLSGILLSGAIVPDVTVLPGTSIRVSVGAAAVESPVRFVELRRCARVAVWVVEPVNLGVVR